MPFKIPTDNAVLLASANSSVILTPKQKFDKYIKKKLGSPKRNRKYHFKAVEHGNLVFLFDGLGRELKEFSNDFKGNRECRSFAFDTYMQAKDRLTAVGGYIFDFIGEK